MATSANMIVPGTVGRSRWCAFWALILGVLALHAVGAVLVRIATEALGKSKSVATILGLGVGAGALVCGVVARGPLARILAGLTRSVGRLDRRRVWWAALLAGIGIRLGYGLLFAAPQTSDAATYVALAEGMATKGVFEVGGHAAYWPPGFPLFLFPFAKTVGLGSGVILAINLLLYFGSHVFVGRLAAMSRFGAAPNLVLLLLASWPGYWTGASLASKEHLLLVLLPLLIWWWMLDNSWARSVWPFFAGLALGFACLTQPSQLLFFTALFAVDLVRRIPLRISLVRLAALFLGMAIVISPWTLRNREVFGQTVLIATNGGSNFYRANNPLAHGGFMERGEVDLSPLSGLEADREGFRLGKQWVRDNPADFVKLSLWKQALFMGDDAASPFFVLKRGLGIDGMKYNVFKLLCTGAWWVAWLLLLFGLLRKDRAPLEPLAAMATITFAYFFSLHSVFESSAKYHQPAWPFLLLALGSVLASGRSTGTRETGSP